MLRRVFLSATIILVFLAGLTLAGIPKLINYQGMLTDNSGVPLSGSYSLTFKIYDDTTTGTLKWSETQSGVQVQNGLFNVVLGKVSALNLAFDQSYWLEVGVGAETMPRIRITSVGYAYRAQVADSATVAPTSSTGGGWTDNGTSVRLSTSADSVGIGMTSPNEKLTLEGAFSLDEVSAPSATSGYGKLYVKSTDSKLYFKDDGGSEYNLTSAGAGGGWTDAGTAVRLSTSADSVGIGMTSPNEKLTVEGALSLDEVSAPSATSGYGKLYVKSTDSKLYFKDDGGSEYSLTSPGAGGGWTDDGTTVRLSTGSDNVGIGTTSPSCKLHLSASDASYGMLKIENSNPGDNEATLGFKEGSDAGVADIWVAGVGPWGNPNDFVIGRGAAKFLITPDGKVGIGLNNPNRKLYVVENVSGVSYPLKIDNPHSTFNTDATGILFSVGGQGSSQLDTSRGKGALVYQYTDTWNRGSFHFLQDNNANADNPDFFDRVMTIRNDGKVGIGTTSPDQLLELEDTSPVLRINTTFRQAGLEFAMDGNQKWELGWNSDWDYLRFYSNIGTPGTRMVIKDSAGWVGIGTANPTAQLHVVRYKPAAPNNEGWLGTYGCGVEGKGSTGGHFDDNDGTSSVSLAQGWSGGKGIVASGNVAGGEFNDYNSSGWATVASGDDKIRGTGSLDFVQNHPYEKDKVIVHTAPEGDETATYTRGTAKLSGGEAHVQLGETFKLVTNPDLGLTAHITPRGECEGLYVASLTTSEMVVKELRGGTSNVEFDYLVYGLRIGFEETSVIQEKERESYIPSMNHHRERYSLHPEFRQYNALERFKRMNSEMGKPALDMNASRNLKDAIHEFDPAIDKIPGTDKF